MQMDRYIRA